MSEIKLEVGKAYLSRRGEEVRIVEKDSEYRYPYQGSNSKWYTGNGRYWHKEHPEDLIEELPETRHAFDIPDGVKKVTVEQVGNRIVVEMVPEKEPKAGDVMINKWGSVYIFKEVRGESHEYFACLGRDGRVYYHSVAIPGRPATPEEAQPLFDALKKAGKRWNPETMEVEDVPESERIMSFLQRYGENVKWNHRQLCLLIECYLNYKEDEK